MANQERSFYTPMHLRNCLGKDNQAVLGITFQARFFSTDTLTQFGENQVIHTRMPISNKEQYISKFFGGWVPEVDDKNQAWVQVSFFNKLGERFAKFAEKHPNATIVVTGNLQAKPFTAKDGTQHYSLNVNAFEFFAPNVNTQSTAAPNTGYNPAGAQQPTPYGAAAQPAPAYGAPAQPAPAYGAPAPAAAPAYGAPAPVPAPQPPAAPQPGYGAPAQPAPAYGAPAAPSAPAPAPAPAPSPAPAAVPQPNANGFYDLSDDDGDLPF